MARKWLGWGLALALIALVFSLAGFDRIGRLLVSVDSRELFWAAMASAASLGFRSIRLSLLLRPSELGFLRAFPVTAVAQMAAVFIPARLGELALPVLLQRATGRPKSSGLAILLAARTLDTAALGAWALAALILRRNAQAPMLLAGGALLFLPLILLPLIVKRIDGLMTDREEAWREKGRRWAERMHRIREGMDEALGHPARLGGAALACLGSWSCQWILTWKLLAGMGYHWPAWDIITGAAAASLSNLLPLSIVANLGTLEAGWTAAFAAMGIPTATAAATGFATHLWALVLAALVGAICWPLLPRGKED